MTSRSAKDIRVTPISRADADRCVLRLHYSRKIVRNTQLHLGVFLDGRLEGAMQFGPSLDKRKVQSLVSGTSWNGFLELNRMAFSDRLPRNSESRALGVACRLIRARYPHVEWIVSFADAAQCGDGAIYRAAGFVLTAIRRNNSILQLPDGSRICNVSLHTGLRAWRNNGSTSSRLLREQGAHPLEGYQLRYVKFLNPEARARLTVGEVPFSKIEDVGAGMYRGQTISRRRQKATLGSPEEAAVQSRLLRSSSSACVAESQNLPS